MSHIHKLSYNHLSSFKPPPKLLKDSISHIEIENNPKNAIETDFSIISADSNYQDQFEEIVEQEFSLPLFQSSLDEHKTMNHLIYKPYEDEIKNEIKDDYRRELIEDVEMIKDEQGDYSDKFNLNPLTKKIHRENLITFEGNNIFETNDRTSFEASFTGKNSKIFEGKGNDMKIDVAKSYIDILKEAEHEKSEPNEIKIHSNIGLKEPIFDFHFEFDFDIESYKKQDLSEKINNNMKKIHSEHKVDSNLEESEYEPDDDRILNENFENGKVDTLFQESNSERFDTSFQSSICEDYLQIQFNKELNFKTSGSNEFNDILTSKNDYENFYENQTNEKKLYEFSPEKKALLASCTKVESEQKSEIYETLEMEFQNFNLNLDNIINLEIPLKFDNFRTSNEKKDITNSENFEHRNRNDMGNSNIFRSPEEKDFSSSICEVRTNEKNEQNIYESPEIRKNEIILNYTDDQKLSEFYNSPTLGKNSKIQNTDNCENSYSSQEKINEAFCASINASDLLNSEPNSDFLNNTNNGEIYFSDNLNESEKVARKLRDCALSNIYPSNNDYDEHSNQNQNKIIFSPRFRENTDYNDFEIEQIILRKSQAVYQSQSIQSEVNQSDFSFAEMDPENKENSSAVYSDLYNDRKKCCIFEKNLLSPRFDDSRTENLSFSNFYDKTVNKAEQPKLFLKAHKKKEKNKIVQKSRKLSVMDENKYIEKIISSTAENSKYKMKKGLMNILEEKGKINFKKKKNIF